MAQGRGWAPQAGVVALLAIALVAGVTLAPRGGGSALRALMPSSVTGGRNEPATPGGDDGGAAGADARDNVASSGGEVQAAPAEGDAAAGPQEPQQPGEGAELGRGEQTPTPTETGGDRQQQQQQGEEEGEGASTAAAAEAEPPDAAAGEAAAATAAAGDGESAGATGGETLAAEAAGEERAAEEAAKAEAEDEEEEEAAVAAAGAEEVEELDEEGEEALWAGAANCTASDMCSLGVSADFVDDLTTHAGLAAAMVAVAFKGEVILGMGGMGT